jgi:hypothetical protein
MKFNRCIAIVAAIFLIAVSGLATADRLPNPVPENQIFTTESFIDAVGQVSESTTVVWEIGDRGFAEIPAARRSYNSAGDTVTGIASGSIAYVTYSDSILTNGGQLSEVKSFKMDTHSKTAGMYNIQTEKVLTYTSQNGSHLMGGESYVLDVAGNWSSGSNGIVCVFASGGSDIIPAFCNRVSASSKLNQITTAQIESVGGVTAVSRRANTPAALTYEISVVPDANSASGYADGIVSTTFTVAVMEGRSDGNRTTTTQNGLSRMTGSDYNAYYGTGGLGEEGMPYLAGFNELAATVTFVDTATMAGGISTFSKAFNYQSSSQCSNC